MSKHMKFTDEAFIEAVRNAVSVTGVLRLLGRRIYGGSSALAVKNRIKKLSLDTSHFTGQAWNKGKQFPARFGNIYDLLCENSQSSNTNGLKKRLLKLGLLENRCGLCGLYPTWNGSPLVLQMDHRNGVKTDNRLDNLIIVCPNCHTQTSTYAGRNKQYKDWSVQPRTNPSKKATKNVCSCGSFMSTQSLRCARCAAQYSEKIGWPSDEELYAMVWEEPTSSVAKKLGVSDASIAKRCKKRGIMKPPRGYWEKKYHGQITGA